MFRRKEDGTEELISDNESPTTGSSGNSTPSSSASPVTPAITPAAPVNPVPAAPAPQAASFRPAPPQAAMAATRSAASLNPTPAAPAPSASSDASRSPASPARPSAKRVLTVGPEIQMKGEITSCDRVVIEGVVDATMRDVHTVELAETGTLKGTAEVEDAEISGTFEGDLLVRGKLTVHSSGRVRGNVTYGEIEIQRGGQISGNVRNVADAKNAAVGGKKAA